MTYGFRNRWPRRPATLLERARFRRWESRLTRSARRDLSESRSLELPAAGRVSVPAADGRKLVLGGQYLRVPAGTRLRVDLDLEVLAEMATELRGRRSERFEPADRSALCHDEGRRSWRTSVPRVGMAFACINALIA